MVIRAVPSQLNNANATLKLRTNFTFSECDQSWMSCNISSNLHQAQRMESIFCFLFALLSYWNGSNITNFTLRSESSLTVDSKNYQRMLTGSKLFFGKNKSFANRQLSKIKYKLPYNLYLSLHQRSNYKHLSIRKKIHNIKSHTNIYGRGTTTTAFQAIILRKNSRNPNRKLALKQRRQLNV